MQDDGIRWELYPHVAATPQARAFIVRLCQFSRCPKTLDAYARNLDRFLATFDTDGELGGSYAAMLSAISNVKADVRVLARGTSAIHSPRRRKFSAAAVRTCPRCTRVRPI